MSVPTDEELKEMLNYGEIIPWSVHTSDSEEIQINGFLYVARKSRGPQNVELIAKDIRDIEWKLTDLPLKYNHGYDPVFGDRPIGRITHARLTNTGAIWIEASIFNDDLRLSHELREIIRNQLKSGELSMFSMYWDARTIGEVDGKPVIDPSDRTFHEISVCKKGYYEEARIISFAASSDSGGLSKFVLFTFTIFLFYSQRHRGYHGFSSTA